tara:strand:- start:805 stop:2298 length:1494 start_codon:yes stop_codon:yes gene_type:complete
MDMRKPLFLALWLGVFTLSSSGLAQVPAPSPRNTPLVALIRSCLPAVVSIRTLTPLDKADTYQVRMGSGSIIHETGYILTNEHVIANAVQGAVTLNDGRTLPYRVIASFTHEDLALLKVNAGNRLSSLRLGRSHDLMLGEPTLVVGNPGGLTQSVSAGIVSGLNRAASTESAFLPSLIQTSAAVSGGSSGGPLINALGEQIGVITSKNTSLENVNFAISIDRVRAILRPLLAIEERYGIQIDLDIDPFAPIAQVLSVQEHSPAARSDIRKDDVLTQIGNFQIHQGFDYYLALIDRQPGQPLDLVLQRGQQELRLRLTPAAASRLKPIAPPILVPGLHYSVANGQWDRLPDWRQLQPVACGLTERVGLPPTLGLEDHFALQLHGFIQIPREGIYTFSTISDDGSRLYIGNRLIVENDGLHAPQQSAGHVYLKAGLFPVRIEFFENSGGQSLQAFWSGPGVQYQEIAGQHLFHATLQERPPEPAASSPLPAISAGNRGP